MSKTQDASQLDEFHESELVTWHHRNGIHAVPVPAVVVRREPDCVIIRCRIEDKIKELRVDPEELAAR